MLTEQEKRIQLKELEFLTELKGVQLRLGYILFDGNPCASTFPNMPTEIAWELGVEPDSQTGQLLATFYEYIEKKREC
jgi:hypothetical protein